MQAPPTKDHIAIIYRFCAQSMQYPGPDWFTENYLKSLHIFLRELGATDESNELLKLAAQSDDFQEDLQVEFTRLFITGVPHVAAPPYGSVYLEKTLRGKYSDDVFLYYKDQGYSLNENADLPDSLIHQLEFLSYLAEDNNKKAEEFFLSRYFLPWFSIFSSRVKEEAQHPFYAIIISLIDFFTQEEEEYGVQSNEA